MYVELKPKNEGDASWVKCNFTPTKINKQSSAKQFICSFYNYVTAFGKLNLL